jgi:hypothetical protein
MEIVASVTKAAFPVAAVAGGGGGGLVLLVIVVVIVCVACRRRRGRQQQSMRALASESASMKEAASEAPSMHESATSVPIYGHVVPQATVASGAYELMNIPARLDYASVPPAHDYVNLNALTTPPAAAAASHYDVGNVAMSFPSSSTALSM